MNYYVRMDLMITGMNRCIGKATEGKGMVIDQETTKRIFDSWCGSIDEILYPRRARGIVIFEYEFKFLSTKEYILLKNHYNNSIYALEFYQIEVKEGVYNIVALFSKEQNLDFLGIAYYETIILH